MRFAAVSSLVLFTALTTPSHAFDDLLEAVGLMPPVLDGYLVFDYVSPSRGFDVVDAMAVGTSDDALNMALLTGGQDPATGIDFGKVNSVVMLGAQPAVTTVIFGTAGFAENAPDALLARDFTATERGDRVIYSLGDDFALDLAAATAETADPLGSGTGRSQRLAIADDHIIRTASWPEIGLAMSMMDSAPAYTQIWSDTIRAMQTAAGQYANLERASAWNMFAFSDAGMGLTPDDLPSLGGKIKLKTQDIEPALAFPFAVIGITLDDEVAGLHIAIPYGNAYIAQDAGEIIAARLAEFPMDNMPEAEFDVVPPGEPDGTTPVLVVSLKLASPERSEIQAIYNRFINAIYQRDFQPLMSGA